MQSKKRAEVAWRAERVACWSSGGWLVSITLQPLQISKWGQSRKELGEAAALAPAVQLRREAGYALN